MHIFGFNVTDQYDLNPGPCARYQSIPKMCVVLLSYSSIFQCHFISLSFLSLDGIFLYLFILLFFTRWHLGFCNEACTPPQRGFDTFFGFYQGYIDHYNHLTGMQQIHRLLMYLKSISINNFIQASMYLWLFVLCHILFINSIVYFTCV